MASDQLVRDDKKDPTRLDGEESPLGSSVDGESGEPCEGEGDGEAEGDAGQPNPTPDQPVKRKGGRKPIYATTEERKQRNRQAQAAFRERRTEYIKQLETSLNVQEHTLNNLNAAHRTAMDECLMLRYKNSLLERILLEKGIDVQSELQIKHGSPNFGPTHVPPMIPATTMSSRSLMNRHHSRRSASSIAPKVETGFSLPPIQQSHGLPAGSPKARPSAASPTAPEGFGHSPASSDNAQGAMRPPRNQMRQPGQHPMGQQMANPARMMPPPAAGQQQAAQGLAPHLRAAAAANTAPFYQSPQYASHLEQLEQEYDAQADLMDDSQQQQGQNDGDVGGPGPYPGSAYATHAAQQPQAQQMSPTSTIGDAPQQQHGIPMPGIMDPGSMDWGDPFGLSASMQFPNSSQFSFDTSSLR